MRYTQPSVGPLAFEPGNPYTRGIAGSWLAYQRNLLDNVAVPGQKLTAYGGPTFPVDAVHGQGVLLNGTSQYLETTGFAQAGNTYPLTLGAWFRMDSVAGGNQTIIALTPSGGTSCIFQLYVSAGVLYARQYNTGSVLTDSASIPVGSWHHAEVVFTSASSRSLYKDGVLVATDTTTASAPSGMNQVDIGASPWAGPGEFFTGMITSPVVINRALGGAEIRDIAANPWQLFKDQRRVLKTSGASGTAVNPGVGSVALTGYAPTLAQTANQALTAGVGNLAITGYAPTVAQASSASLTPGVGTIAITGYAPTIAQPQTAAPSAESIALAGYAPGLTQTANQAVAPGGGSVALTGYAPAVTQAAGSPSLTPDTGALAITGYAPGVQQTAPLIKSGGDDVPREEERIEIWERRKPTPRRDAALDKVLREAFDQATGKAATIKPVAPIAQPKPVFIDYEDEDEEALLLLM